MLIWERWKPKRRRRWERWWGRRKEASKREKRILARKEKKRRRRRSIIGWRGGLYRRILRLNCGNTRKKPIQNQGYKLRGKIEQKSESLPTNRTEIPIKNGQNTCSVQWRPPRAIAIRLLCFLCQLIKRKGFPNSCRKSDKTKQLFPWTSTEEENEV